MRPISAVPRAVNQSAPSDPGAIPSGLSAPVSRKNSLMLPAVVMRPILLRTCSANQSAPSDPTVIPTGPFALEGIGYSVIVGVAATADPTIISSPTKPTTTDPDTDKR